MKFILKKEKGPVLSRVEGFTIIELVISIFVLSFAVVGIFSAFSIMAILTADSANRLTATYLTQEGMEIVRNIRDTNWLNMDYFCAQNNCSSANEFSWVDGLTSTGACSSTGCEADYTSPRLLGKSGDYLNTDVNGFYSYATGTQTKFKRKITITQVPDVDGQSDHIVKVKVEVSWDEKTTILNSGAPAGNCVTTGGTNNCVAAEETLYDWYNYVNH
jgi:Tfp pilus assembly protein PilV